MTAILFGSIGTLADTSEVQRQSFNEAFAIHDLDWQWDREQYIAMLGTNGGEQRIARYAEARGVTVDAAAVHATKTAKFHELLASAELEPRSGVADTIRRAKAAGTALALVTTTSPANVTAILTALEPGVARTDFDVITDATQVDQPKPAADAYALALTALDQPASSCVAIEDNLGGVAGANAAGIACVAFPNENTADHDFGPAVVVDQINLDELCALLAP